MCSCTGFMGRPKLPGVLSIETLKGHSFHTCRWDCAYTGGDNEGNLTGLKDKRVGVIGTGASATTWVICEELASRCADPIADACIQHAVKTRITDQWWLRGPRSVRQTRVVYLDREVIHEGSGFS